jgi:hypothetical protein
MALAVLLTIYMVSLRPASLYLVPGWESPIILGGVGLLLASVVAVFCLAFPSVRASLKQEDMKGQLYISLALIGLYVILAASFVLLPIKE